MAIINRVVPTTTPVVRNYHYVNPSLYSSTAYECILQLFKRQLGQPVNFTDVEIRTQSNLSDDRLVATFYPKSHSQLVENLTITYDRIPLEQYVPDTLYLAATLPLNLTQVAQYFMNRYHFLIEPDDFDLVYDLRDPATEIRTTQRLRLDASVVLDADLLSALDPYLEARPTSQRFTPGGQVRLVINALGVNDARPLVGSYLPDPGHQLQIDGRVTATGGNAPYRYLLSRAFSRVDNEGVSFEAQGVVIDPITGILSSPNQIVGSYSGAVDVRDDSNALTTVEITLDCQAMSSDLYTAEFDVPLFTCLNGRNWNDDLTETDPWFTPITFTLPAGVAPHGISYWDIVFEDDQGRYRHNTLVEVGAIDFDDSGLVILNEDGSLDLPLTVMLQRRVVTKMYWVFRSNDDNVLLTAMIQFNPSARTREEILGNFMAQMRYTYSDSPEINRAFPEGWFAFEGYSPNNFGEVG